MRSVANIVGGIGTSGAGDAGDILYKIGPGDDAYEWTPLATLLGNGIVNGDSSVTIPVEDEDVLYDAAVGFVHKFRVDGDEVGNWGATELGILGRLSATGDEESTNVFTSKSSNVSFDGAVASLESARLASTEFDFIRCTSDTESSPDVKFKVDGEGRMHSDEPVIIDGADYAEMFEWEDGNPHNEDRIGISVVLLPGGFIREATAEDTQDPIGVISHKPTVLGDAAPLHWQGKYARDEFGREIGKTLSEDFDDLRVYTPREHRQEYGCVGCLGKIAVRNGQRSGSRWLPIRAVSDNVTLYWVR